tara:strand:+ start:3550 stop:4011 length:462 start_codon:yes stop_codon:yes gene_type:complete
MDNLNLKSQIGGKGTVRRKVKRTGNVFQKRVTKEDIDFKNKVVRINNLVENILDNYEYTKFKLFVDCEFEEIGNSIDKCDLKKIFKDDYDDIKEDQLDYIYKLLVKDIDRPLKFNENYKNIKERFEDDILEIINNFIRDVEISLEKKSYLDKR